jgi:sulfur-oxidizing protein SoxY
MRRRELAGTAMALIVAPLAREARATPALDAALNPALNAALMAFSQGTPLRDGRVTLDIAPLVENGNTVPVTVAVPGAEPGEVRRLALFTERNPQPEVAVFTLGPLAGRAMVATRMRLATSQAVVAVAQMADGSCWQQRVTVVVTLAACVEGE